MSIKRCAEKSTAVLRSRALPGVEGTIHGTLLVDGKRMGSGI